MSIAMKKRESLPICSLRRLNGSTMNSVGFGNLLPHADSFIFSFFFVMEPIMEPIFVMEPIGIN